MTAKIYILNNVNEKNLPFIKLTKSINGKTGTATFLFIQPSSFDLLEFSFININAIYLVWETNTIFTRDVTIRFHEGKPFSLKAIFLFKNNQQWFQFLNFMTIYAKQQGLFFSET